MASPRIVSAEPLTEAAYARYGGIVAADLARPQTVSTNGGTAKRWVEVVQPENRYDQSGKAGRLVVNVSLSAPRPVKDGGERRQTFTLEMLERHPFTTQMFVPMSADAKYLVVVAENKVDDDTRPDLETLRAFVASSGQGICYKTGLWHAPMAVIGRVRANPIIIPSPSLVYD